MYRCDGCNHTWRTVEIAVHPDPLAPGAVMALGGHLRIATAAGHTLSRLSLSEQRVAAQDALARQGRARRATEDQRIDREAEDRAAGYLGGTSRKPARKK